MKQGFSVLLAATLCVALGSAADAAPRAKRSQAQAARAQAQAECLRQASDMRLAYKSVMRRNFLRDCMTEHGFPRP